MVKSLKIVLLFIGIASAQSPDELYKTAQANLDAGKVSEAESGFNSALQTDPTFAPAYLGLAHTSMRMGDLAKTGKLLNEAIEIEPENQSFRDESERLSELNTLMSKGKRQLQNGDADEAFETFRIALDKFPNYPGAAFSIGVTHLRAKKFEDAVTYFRKTIDIYPDHPKAHSAINNVAKNYFLMGLQLYKRGDLDGALSSWSNALDVDKAFHQAHYQIGVIQSKMGDKDAAILSYENALKINPQFYKGYFSLGLAKSSMNDNDGALSALQSAVDIKPDYDKAYGAMGDIYIRTGNYEKAKQVLNMANPNYVRGYSLLGIIYADEKNWDMAISSLKKAVTLNDKDSMSFFRLASAYNSNGNCGGAKEAARKSADLKSRFGGSWFELGVAEWCGGRGNKAGALNAFEKARNDRDWRKSAEHEIDKVKNPQKYEK